MPEEQSPERTGGHRCSAADKRRENELRGQRQTLGPARIAAFAHQRANPAPRSAHGGGFETPKRYEPAQEDIVRAHLEKFPEGPATVLEMLFYAAVTGRLQRTAVTDDGANGGEPVPITEMERLTPKEQMDCLHTYLNRVLGKPPQSVHVEARMAHIHAALAPEVEAELSWRPPPSELEELNPKRVVEPSDDGPTPDGVR